MMEATAMIKKIHIRFKPEGRWSLLTTIYRRILSYACPKYYPHCQTFFQSKVGLEIGGPSSIFKQEGLIPIYPIAARIDNCNFGGQTIWEGVISAGNTFKFDNSKKLGHQYIDEASNLKNIGDAAYDFVLSSHCIEHLANPLQGLSEWMRVLKQGGVLVLVAPHKDGTFDHRRPVSSMAHLIEDFETHIGEDDMTHLEEILRLHDLSKDPGAGDFQSFQDRSKRNVENRCLHQHVFDTRAAVEMVNYMGLQILTVEVLQPFHIIILAQKVNQNQTINNERFRGVDGMPYWRSPFPSDA